MKISDRDKKLILFVLLVAIIALPIFLFINPRRKATAELEEELVGLNERYEYLKDLTSKQETYEKEIERLNAERDELIKGFAGGVLVENTIMFLRETEILNNKDFRATLIAFSEDEITPVTDSSVDANGNYVEGLTAIKSSVTVDYCGQYNNIVEFLNYIFNQEDKMVISAFSMELDESTNLIVGTFILDQYAISGNGKEVEQKEIPSMNHGTDRLFDQMYDSEGRLLDYWLSIGVTDYYNEENNKKDDEE